MELERGADAGHPLKLCEQYKLNTDGDFFYLDHHLELETTEISPEEATRRVIDRFGFGS